MPPVGGLLAAEVSASLERWTHVEVLDGEEEVSELEVVRMAVVAFPKSTFKVLSFQADPLYPSAQIWCERLASLAACSKLPHRISIP